MGQIKRGVDTAFQADYRRRPKCNKVGKQYVAPKRENGDDSTGDTGGCYQRVKEKSGSRPAQAIPNPDE